MRTLLVGAVAAMLLPWVVSAQNGQNSDFVVHGTVNIALGNKNGIVVLTDSMQTRGVDQLAEPGQKLFKLDDNTVCAVAGYLSAPTMMPEINSSTSAIIHEYIKESAGQPPQNIVEKLVALKYLLISSLSAIANLRDATGMLTPIKDYRLQLIVAGYDLDGTAKIGRITFRTSEQTLFSFMDDVSLDVMTEKLSLKLNGMTDVADELLRHPESHPEDAVLAQYAGSKQSNEGSSMTVDQLVQLAKRLAFYTSQAHREVGGPNQIAVLTGPHNVKLDQQMFQVPTSSPFHFGVMVDSRFRGANAIKFEPGVHELFVRCQWVGVRQELSGHLFIQNTFANSMLTYEGGRTNFGNSNQVINSVLVVAPLIRPDDETLKGLATAFKWLRIYRDFTATDENLNSPAKH